MRFLLRLFITAAALWVAVKLIPGIDYYGPWYGLLAVALVFGAVNAFIRPIMVLLTCPAIIVTLGLFVFVLNAIMLMITSSIASALGFAFEVHGLLPALLGSFVIGITSAFLNMFVADKDEPNYPPPPHE